MLAILIKYFLGRFVRTLIFSMLVFISLFIILDLIEKLDKFVDRSTPFDVILSFYLNSIPGIIVLVLPIAMLLTSLYVTGQFVKKGELTAIKAAGVSLYRFFMPVIIFSFFVSGFSFWYGEYVVPEATRKKEDIWNFDINKRSERRYQMAQNKSFRETNNRFVRIGEYDGAKKIGKRITVLKHENNRIISNIYADSLHNDDGQWVLMGVIKRDFSSGEEVMEKLEVLRVEDFIFTEKDLLASVVDPEDMSIVELREFMAKLKLMGHTFDEYEVSYQHKMAFPFVNVIVVLLGLPLATNKWGGGLAIGFGLCLFICFSYYVTMTFTEALGIKGVISPYVAAWFSNAVFGSFGLYTLISTQK